jgi:hypothetical protein
MRVAFLPAANILEDGPMTLTQANVEGLVVKIQDEFLNAPALRLTLGQVADRVEVGASTCEAVLHALVDSRVLAITSAGAYERFFPRPADRTRTTQSRAA